MKEPNFESLHLQIQNDTVFVSFEIRDQVIVNKTY